MTLLGLDLGQKRIGVAVGDEAMRMAFPLTTLEFRTRKDLLRDIAKIVAEHGVTKIVVGFPKTLAGDLGPAAQKIAEEVEWLKANLEQSFVLWDERLSSQEVERLLISAGMRREKRKEVRDQLAAQRILQNYMDYHREEKKP